jgi:hypothetical protein
VSSKGIFFFLWYWGSNSSSFHLDGNPKYINNMEDPDNLYHHTISMLESVFIFLVTLIDIAYT